MKIQNPLDLKMDKPKYPIYVISKGRSDVCYTANFMLKDNVDFKIVIEPQEYDDYAKFYDEKLLMVTPFANLGQGSIPVRNFIWEDSIEKGHEKHWCVDDNIHSVRYSWNGRRIKCNANIGFNAVETFTDRYENIALSGMNYHFFVPPGTRKPFYQNCRVYSNLLIRNDLDFRWRGRYNEDTDLCLQALSKDWCTVLINAFMIEKNATMSMKGGNATELYVGDGRLRMARDLQEQWPYVVEVKRVYGRPQHRIKFNWRHFDTPLKRRSDINWKKINKQKIKMKIVELDDIKSESLKRDVKKYK
jgi:hypothetical protein